LQDSLRYVAPLSDAVVRNLAQADRVIRAFREGGGVPFDAYGPNFTNAMDDLLGPLLRAKLIPEWLPSVSARMDSRVANPSVLSWFHKSDSPVSGQYKSRVWTRSNSATTR